jgi:carboxypeptidase Taq
MIRELNDKYRTLWALSSAESLLGWDLEVNMPDKGSVARGTVLAEVSLLTQKKMAELYPKLENADEKQGEYNDYEKGVVRILRRRQKFFTKIPPSLLEAEQKIAAEAAVVWRDARKKSDFQTFKPYLEKNVELKREEAEKLGYEGHPYNALLDQYEEGLTVEDVDEMYSKLISALKKILEKVKSEAMFTSMSPLVEKNYSIESMAGVNRKIIEILGMPKDRFRMDLSTHPFEASISRDDVRITTRYEGKDFKSALFSTIHESGHAIYELQIDEKLEFSPIGIAVSNGFHESQSRFWENMIGRSKSFVHLVKPTLQENLDFVGRYNEEELYHYFNLVRPGMIRVDADELTYNFHTALRYELEKKMIGGQVSVSELPQLWNELMESYLGITPRNDSEGILQDVHWSQGSFGYFPTYTLGNVIAGMIWSDIGKEIALDEKIRVGDFDSIKSWLYQKIHRWGSTYAPKDLSKRSLGEFFNPARLVDYLERKFLN